MLHCDSLFFTSFYVFSPQNGTIFCLKYKIHKNSNSNTYFIRNNHTTHQFTKRTIEEEDTIRQLDETPSLHLIFAMYQHYFREVYSSVSSLPTLSNLLLLFCMICNFFLNRSNKQFCQDLLDNKRFMYYSAS